MDKIDFAAIIFLICMQCVACNVISSIALYNLATYTIESEA